MNQLIALLLISTFSAVTIVALLLVVAALFPNVVNDGQQMVTMLAKRSFWFGLLNALLLAIVGLLCIGLVESGAGIFVVPLILVVGASMALIALGLCTMARIVGARLMPTRTSMRQLLIGAIAVTLGSLVPFVGWFGLFPLLVLWGSGGVALGIYRDWRPIKKGEQKS